MNPFSHTGLSISDSLKSVRKSVLIYETIIEKTIWLRKDGILFAVPLHKVICVETRNHILYIHMQEELLEIPYITIKEFMSEADGFGFCQCSRSTVVNKNYIKSVDTINRYISFRGTDKIVEVGPVYRKKFVKEMRNG